MQPITVVIADSDKVKLTAYEYLLRYEQDIEVVGQTTTGEETLATTISLKPKVLVCKFSLAAAGDFALLRKLHKDCSESFVLLSTDRSIHEEQVMDALSKGARGHLSVDEFSTQLPKALRSVRQGEVWVARQTLGRLLDRAARVSCS